MSEHDGPTAPLLDVSVHLFLHLFALKLNVGPIEVFGIDPSNGLVIDVYVVKEKKIRCTDRSAQQFGLLTDHFRLTAEADALVLKPISENVFEQIGFDLRFGLIDAGNSVNRFGCLKFVLLSLFHARRIAKALLDAFLGPSHGLEHHAKDVDGWEIVFF